METIADLAARIDQPLEWVITEARNLGFKDDNGTTTPETLLWEDEADELAYRFEDPTPRYQWQVTEGGAYTFDARDEHDWTL